jgi:hypothetical protein
MDSVVSTGSDSCLSGVDSLDALLSEYMDPIRSSKFLDK